MQLHITLGTEAETRLWLTIAYELATLFNPGFPFSK
jgi:hypothetical protein